MSPSALAAIDLAHGEWARAYDRLLPHVEDPFLHVTPLELPNFVEAACRSGRREQGRGPAQELEDRAAANGSAWNTGVAQRSRAFVEVEAEPHYLASVQALDGTGIDVELGRSHLVYGEWLRRHKRRRDAREQLRTALETFDRAQAPGFAARARRELEAMGDPHVDAPTSDLPDLTAQELTVARLAAHGNTNAEIAATMFLSPNTVDYHLRKVFQKLGISSRRQLKDRIEGT